MRLTEQEGFVDIFKQFSLAYRLGQAGLEFFLLSRITHARPVKAAVTAVPRKQVADSLRLMRAVVSLVVARRLMRAVAWLVGLPLTVEQVAWAAMDQIQAPIRPKSLEPAREQEAARVSPRPW